MIERLKINNQWFYGLETLLNFEIYLEKERGTKVEELNRDK